MLTPMNHREIEHNIKRFWTECKCGEQNISDVFSSWDDSGEREAAIMLTDWLAQTQKAVFQEDLLLDYGQDCLRLYLLFEKTPEPNDTWMDTWEECNLEGCYKFLGRFRRMILVADYANGKGKYAKLDAESIRTKICVMQNEVMKHIAKGNTMSNRHNAISVIMEGIKELHKELRIGELVTCMHSHDIAMAVPHAQKEEAEFTMQESHRNETLDVALEELLVFMAPFVPIMSEYLWQSQNKKESIFQRRWIQQSSQLEYIKIPIQVNAKVKKIITIHKNASREDVETAAKSEISDILKDKVYELIYIPNKIINFVIM